MTSRCASGSTATSASKPEARVEAHPRQAAWAAPPSPSRDCRSFGSAGSRLRGRGGQLHRSTATRARPGGKCDVHGEFSTTSLAAGLLPARRHRLAPEKSQQGGAERGGQDGRRLWIGLLVTLHPAIQFRTSPSDLTVLSQAVLHLTLFATTERQVTLVIRILKKIRNLINPRYPRTADSNISGEQALLVIWFAGATESRAHRQGR